MVRDLIVSFRDNLKERATNPFLGLYFSVLIFRNWEIIYSLFNFNEGLLLEDKIQYINTYFQTHDLLTNLSLNLFWSFLILILTYAALNLSRLIINIFDKRLTPLIYKVTDSHSIVLKTLYEKVIFERNEIQNRLNNERDLKVKLESRIKLLEDKLLESAKKLDVDISNDSEINDDIAVLYRKLGSKNMLSEFIKISNQILKGTYVLETNNIDKFINWDLIKFRATGGDRQKYYDLTEDGKSILRKARLDG